MTGVLKKGWILLNTPAYHEEYNDIDLLEIFGILWNGKSLIITFVTGAIIITILYFNFFAVYLFESKATIQLTNIAGLYSNTEYINQLLQSEHYLNSIIKKLELTRGVMNYQNIKNHLTVKRTEKENIIEVRIRDQDPVIAYQFIKEILNRYQKESNIAYEAFINNKKEYLDYLTEELSNIEQQIIMLEELFPHLLKQDNQSSAFYLSGMEYYKTKRDFKKSKQDLIIELNSYYRTNILKSPHLPNAPVVPNKKMFLAVAVFLGFFGGVFFVLLLNYLP